MSYARPYKRVNTGTSSTVDISGKLDKSGDTMTGNLNMGTNDIICGQITASEVVTANGGLVMGDDDKITLPTTYTTAPIKGQLGGIQSAKNTALFTLTVATWNQIPIVSGTNNYLTLDPGSYILTGSLSFASGTMTGLTLVSIAISTSATGRELEGCLGTPAMNSALTAWNVTRIVSLTASTNFYFLVYTAGTAPNIAANAATLTAIRIG